MLTGLVLGVVGTIVLELAAIGLLQVVTGYREHRRTPAGPATVSVPPPASAPEPAPSVTPVQRLQPIGSGPNWVQPDSGKVN